MSFHMVGDRMDYGQEMFPLNLSQQSKLFCLPQNAYYHFLNLKCPGSNKGIKSAVTCVNPLISDWSRVD